jgi:hypothetical protein
MRVFDKKVQRAAVMNTITAARALTSSSFILVRISFRKRQQVKAPAAIVKNRLISDMGLAAK